MMQSLDLDSVRRPTSRSTSRAQPPDHLVYPADDAEGRRSPPDPQRAQSVPGERADQVLHLRQPHHCQGRRGVQFETLLHRAFRGMW